MNAMCSNVTACHHLRYIMDRSIFIVQKEGEEKEHITYKKEKIRRKGRKINVNTMPQTLICFDGKKKQKKEDKKQKREKRVKERNEEWLFWKFILEDFFFFLNDVIFYKW